MVELLPIKDEDLQGVCDFLHRQMNPRITPDQWYTAFKQPWMVDKPNHGYMLREKGDVVGVLAAIYSQQQINGRLERLCNLTSWRVLEPYSAMSMGLLKAIIKQPDQTVIGTTPSEMVCKIYKLLGFEMVAQTRRVLLPPLGWDPNAKVLMGDAARASLPKAEQQRWLDHADFAWLDQAVLLGGKNEAPCHLVWRRGVWKRLPGAVLMHVGAAETFVAHHGMWSRWLLGKGLPSAHVEQRLVPTLTKGRVEDYGMAMGLKSERLRPEQLSYLYTEQVALPLE
ncbi:hypothetical protein [Magnetococcus sp. PR-3]|uniref:hypothetical protein n=1 Tax=Magnetococcus sp. PR-3 TaxID=3120355 RepID=UPI002FCDFE50